MPKMIEVTKTAGWEMLAEWQGGPNQDVHLKFYGTLMDIQVQCVKDNVPYIGKASGSINLINDVVSLAFADLAFKMRGK
jgi:hypothetical protein